MWTYAQRRPAPYDKTAKRKLQNIVTILKNTSGGRPRIRHRQRDTTSVVPSLNSNVTRALTVRKPSKPQQKRRQTTSSVIEPSEPAPHEQRGSSTVPDQQKQGEVRKRKRPQFYGFPEAHISPTSSLTSSTSSKSKKRKTKNQAPKTTSRIDGSVVELIQKQNKTGFRLHHDRIYKLDTSHPLILVFDTMTLSRKENYRYGTLKMKYND